MSANKLWECPFDILWHTCPRHWNCTLIPCKNTPKQQPLPPSKRYKRTLPLDYRASYEEMLDEDKHKANLKRRREANAGVRWIHLGSGRWTKNNIPPSLLGPTLNKRYKGGRFVSERHRSNESKRGQVGRCNHDLGSWIACNSALRPGGKKSKFNALVLSISFA